MTEFEFHISPVSGLVPAPDESWHRPDEIQKTTRPVQIVCEALRTRDRIVDVEYDPVPPSPQLVSRQAETRETAATDRTFQDHSFHLPPASRMGHETSMTNSPSGTRTSRAEW